MLRFLPPYVRGCCIFLCYILNTAFWIGPTVSFGVLKLLIPIPVWRRFCTRVIKGIANSWISFNNFNFRLFHQIEWDVRGLEGLRIDEWYLVMANHQSWVDIIVLQYVLHRRIPLLKFFLKKELVWVPLMGLAWWAMDYPFMKRYSRSHLEKYPHHKGRDIAITRKACEKFRTLPVSVTNFVEGTRFSAGKQRRQNSPFKHLLRPRAGGIAFVLAAMGDQLNRIVDVTIVYPQGACTFWQFLCGRITQVKFCVETLPITQELLGNYFEDDTFRDEFQEWLNRLWARKDRNIDAMLAPSTGEALASEMENAWHKFPEGAAANHFAKSPPSSDPPRASL